VSVLRPAAFLFLSCALSAKAGEARAKPEQPPVSSNSGYELRGFFGAGKNQEVSLSKSGSETSRWYKVGGKSGDMIVESADAKTGTATLVVRGARHRLRLAGESFSGTPLAPVAAEEAKPAAPDYKSREYRQKRFQELREKLTEAQEEAFGRAMQEGFEKVSRESQSVDFRDPANAELAMKTRVDIMRQASEAAHKLPDKEGKITPVPADFEPLLREEYKAEAEWRNARRAEREKAVTSNAGATNSNP
jgi:hypothetical protein